MCAIAARVRTGTLAKSRLPMLIRYADWKNPTDHELAFGLRAFTAAPLLGVGTRSDIREVARHALLEGDAERFEARIGRWTGPEDALPSGEQPYIGQQVAFVERGPVARLTLADHDAVLRGSVLVLRSGPQTDYVMRDHHTLDVAIYHHWSTGELPAALFHADRHSDWCKDSYLTARRPDQAATWWRLLGGLKRPDGAPVLRERDVHFTTAQPSRAAHDSLQGRDVGASTRVPGCVDSTELDWRQVLERPETLAADWVSLDLDYFQPRAQLRLSSGLLRDGRFARLIRAARVRLFVLSPQFLAGGDRFERWELKGSRHTSLRVLNLLRACGDLSE